MEDLHGQGEFRAKSFLGKLDYGTFLQQHIDEGIYQCSLGQVFYYSFLILSRYVFLCVHACVSFIFNMKP